MDVAGLKRTETPEYVGRAVAALRRVLRRSGRAFHAGELAREYGFIDVDGRQVQPFRVPGSYSPYARSMVSRQ